MPTVRANPVRCSAGGTYLFSAPLVFPAAGGGGITMRDGVIRAAPSFSMAANTSDEAALLMLTAAAATAGDDGARLGLGRIVALYYRSSTSYHSF